MSRVKSFFRWLGKVYKNKISLPSQDFFEVTGVVRFLIIIAAVGGLGMIFPGQSSDLFLSLKLEFKEGFFKADKSDIYVLTLLSISALFWSLILWFSGRVLLRLEAFHISREEGEEELARKEIARKERLIRWVPRFLGLMPTLILTLATLMAGREHSSILPLYFLFLGVFYMAFVIFRGKFFKMNPTERFQYSGTKFKGLNKGVILWIRIGQICCLVVVTLFLLPVELGIARTMQTPTVFFLGLSFISLVGAQLTYFDRLWKRVPLGLLVVAYLVLFNIWNNNHWARVIESDTRVVPKPFEQHLEDWLEAHAGNVGDTSAIPLLIVSAEGGGIRALNWTAGTLDHLNQKITTHSDGDFYSHVFAVSGVSGGSVGAAFYQAYYHDIVSPGKEVDQAKFNHLIASDYLSAVLGAMFFPDLIQRFLPFRVGYFDRARWIEDTFAGEYEFLIGHNTMDLGLTTLWEREDSLRLPSMFFNTTRIETGQKVIISNLNFQDDSATSHYFSDVPGLLEVGGRDLPLKTAALMSARFPYVTPAGTVRKWNGEAWGNLVDGGYFENTGLETSLQLLNRILHELENNDNIRRDIRDRIRLGIVFLKNGDTNFEEQGASNAYIDLKAPPMGLIGSWGRRVEFTAKIVKSTMGNLKMPSEENKAKHPQFFLFELDRKTGTENENEEIELPLGWFLSPKPRDEIKLQIELITNPDRLEGRDTTDAYINNRDTFKELNKFFSKD